MVRPSVAVNQNVVKKYQHKAAEEGSQDVVYQGLERRRSVAQTERHDQELVEAVMSAERRLVDVSRAHADLVVPRTEVELGEEARPVELVQQLVDHGDGEDVLDRERVECPVVDAEPPRAVLLLDEEHRGRKGGVAAPYVALPDHGSALPLQFVLVSRRVPVRPNCHRQRAWLENDVVVARALRGQTRWFGEKAAEGGQ